jgi:hypothetical protein
MRYHVGKYVLLELNDYIAIREVHIYRAAPGNTRRGAAHID